MIIDIFLPLSLIFIMFTLGIGLTIQNFKNIINQQKALVLDTFSNSCNWWNSEKVSFTGGSAAWNLFLIKIIKQWFQNDVKLITKWFQHNQTIIPNTFQKHSKMPKSSNTHSPKNNFECKSYNKRYGGWPFVWV